MELDFSEKYSQGTGDNGQKVQQQKVHLDLREKHLPWRLAALGRGSERPCNLHPRGFSELS